MTDRRKLANTSIIRKRPLISSISSNVFANAKYGVLKIGLYSYSDTHSSCSKAQKCVLLFSMFPKCILDRMIVSLCRAVFASSWSSATSWLFLRLFGTQKERIDWRWRFLCRWRRWFRFYCFVCLRWFVKIRWRAWRFFLFDFRWCQFALRWRLAIGFLHRLLLWRRFFRRLLFGRRFLRRFLCGRRFLFLCFRRCLLNLYWWCFKFFFFARRRPAEEEKRIKVIFAAGAFTVFAKLTLIFDSRPACHFHRHWNCCRKLCDAVSMTISYCSPAIQLRRLPFSHSGCSYEIMLLLKNNLTMVQQINVAANATIC